MKLLPWRHRAEKQRQSTEDAEKRLREVEADWPHVHSKLAPVRREQQMNGFSDLILTTVYRKGERA